ncbi:MAG: membrane protein insertion efficiency factor YidD [Candidatus Dojkabacteria bacterium]|nr:membrane protein insertion efficiency factor YidD [Candidatus Dojkabacteria bacterium]
MIILKTIDNFLKSIGKFLIRLYQLTLSLDHSPLWKKFGVRACIHYPSCSEYTYEAIDKYGIIKGSYLGGKRVLRCNPLSKGGYDPVP